MSWLDSFMANKAPIGFILTVIGTGLLTSPNPTVFAWGQAFLAMGPALIGGGVMQPDSHYKSKIELEKLKATLQLNDPNKP